MCIRTVVSLFMVSCLSGMVLASYGKVGPTPIEQSCVEECEINGYTKLRDDLCIKVVDTALPYADAHLKCKEEGGRLVRLDTEDKLALMRYYLIYYTGSYANCVYYINGCRKNTNEKWVFTTGTEVPCFAWAKGEPNNYNGDNCLALYTADFIHGDTVCHANDGYNPFGYICERVF